MRKAKNFDDLILRPAFLPRYSPATALDFLGLGSGFAGGAPTLKFADKKTQLDHPVAP